MAKKSRNMGEKQLKDGKMGKMCQKNRLKDTRIGKNSKKGLKWAEKF